MRATILALATLAGLYGAAGVALSAAGAHSAGGALATTAGHFLLVHAAALVALAAVAAHAARRAALVVGAALIALGTALFSGHLALHALAGLVPLPFAAPLGGSLTILGWLIAAVGVPMALATPARDTVHRA